MTNERFTDLNDTLVDGVASSSTQGEFLGSVDTLPEPSEEWFGRLLLYVGSDPTYTRLAFHECVQDLDGTWKWVRRDMATPYELRPLMAVQSDETGRLVSSKVTFVELERLSGIKGNVQELLDQKQPSIKGGAVTLVDEKLQPNRILVSDAAGNVAVGAVSVKELTSLYGVTEPIQQQLDGKVGTNITINGKPLSSDVVLTPMDVGCIPSDTPIPTRISQLVNDTGFIVDDTESLENYYLKSETYTKSEVNSLVVMLPEMNYVSVDTLPTEGSIGYVYLIPVDEGGWCEQYIWTEDGWVSIGTTKVNPEVSQTPEGIVINGIALQGATPSQSGLMSADQASALVYASTAIVMGGQGEVSDGILRISLDTPNGEVDLNPIPLPASSGGDRMVRRRDVSLGELMSVSVSEGACRYEVSEDFDVEVCSAGRFAETNGLLSVITVPQGSYDVIQGHDLVFSNAESNSRVGVRVVLGADGAMKVYDCNGIVIDPSRKRSGPLVTSTETSYAVSVVRLG